MFCLFYMQGTVGVNSAFEEDAFGFSSFWCIWSWKGAWLFGNSGKFLAQIAFGTNTMYVMLPTNLPTKLFIEKQLYPKYD